MADVYEVLLAVDLSSGISEPDLAELRWHIGAGGRPEAFPIGTDGFVDAVPLGDPADPDCQWETAEPEPLFAERGAARHVGGVLVADLVSGVDGWALTARQELHPDTFYPLRALLDWLGPRLRVGGSQFAGFVRFYESVEVSPLLVEDGRIAVPDEIEEHTPDWE